MGPRCHEAASLRLEEFSVVPQSPVFSGLMARLSAHRRSPASGSPTSGQAVTRGEAVCFLVGGGPEVHPFLCRGPRLLLGARGPVHFML